MLNITNEIAGKCHIKFRDGKKTKQWKQGIGRTCRCGYLDHTFRTHCTISPTHRGSTPSAQLPPVTTIFSDNFHLVCPYWLGYRDCKCGRPFHMTSEIVRSPHLVAVTWKYKKPCYRVLHTLDVAADNGITADFRLARPQWNNMARLSCHAKYPNPLQMYGWAICFEINCTWRQMSHRVLFAYGCGLEV